MVAKSKRMMDWTVSQILMIFSCKQGKLAGRIPSMAAYNGLIVLVQPLHKKHQDLNSVKYPKGHVFIVAHSLSIPSHGFSIDSS